MITSKQIIYLCERYLKSGNSVFSKKQIDIYENPTSSDIVKMIKTARETPDMHLLTDVRFVIDAKNKSIYVADAQTCIHADLLSTLKIRLSPWIFEGIAEVENGKLVVTDEDSIEDSLYLSRIATATEFEWSWISSFISFPPYIKFKLGIK